MTDSILPQSTRNFLSQGYPGRITADSLNFYSEGTPQIDPITGIDTNLGQYTFSDSVLGDGPAAGSIPGTKPGAVNWATGLKALTGVGQLALGKQGLDLSKDKYASSIAQYNRNLANQAQTVNNQLRDQYRNTLVAGGRAPTNPDGSIDYKALGDITEQYVKERGVSGAPIR